MTVVVVVVAVVVVVVVVVVVAVEVVVVSSSSNSSIVVYLSLSKTVVLEACVLLVPEEKCKMLNDFEILLPFRSKWKHPRALKLFHVANLLLLQIRDHRETVPVVLT